MPAHARPYHSGAGTVIGKSASSLAFFGGTPTAQPSAYTQTYSTTTKTVPAQTAVTLTAATGTSDGTVQDVTASFSQTILNNNFQDIATALNATIADVLANRKLINALVDDLQALGLAL